VLSSTYVGWQKHVVGLYVVAQSPGYYCIYNLANGVEQCYGTVCFRDCVVGFARFA
jgi:hypothetical protein